MFDIPRCYTSACSYAVQPVRLYPILMSILLHHFKELTECISEVERIETKVNRKKRGLTSTSGIRIDYHTLPASKGIFACSAHSRNVVASSMQRRQSGLLANLSSSSGRKRRSCGRSQFTG